MKRLVIAPLIILTAVSSVTKGQYLTPPSPDTQTSSENNPPPDDPPGEEECDKCKENSDGGGGSDGGAKYKSASEDASGKTCGEDKENDSIRYTVGLGTTLYQSKNNFVARDMGRRKPKFSKYNPPTTDASPYSSSLSSEWKNRLTRPVVIGLATDEITEATFTPAVLEIRSGNSGTAWVKKDASGALRQILSDQYLTDITVPSTGGVLISSYLRSTIGALDSGTGLYTIPANARKFRTVLISRPTPTGLDTVDITTTDYSSSETMPKIRGARWVKSGTGTAADWTLSHHSGQPTAQNLISSDELIKEDLGGGLIQRTRTIRKPDSNGNPVIHSVTREKYRDLGNNTLRIVERVEAPGTPEELTTTYTYTDLTGTGVIGLNGVVTQPAAGTTTNLLTGARLHTMQRSDGYWEEYKYQYNGGTKIMLTEKWSVWKNSAFGDKANSRYTTITLEEGSRTVIEKIAGQIVSNVYEKLTLAADGTRTLREERKTGTNTAPLITEYAYFPDTAAEPNKGRIQYTRHPDGTLTRYTYASVADPVTSGQTALKATVETGAVDAAQFAPAATGPVPALTMGTRTETITNAFEKVIDAKTWDIASGLLIEQAVATAVDAVGRPTHIIHDGDPDDFENFTFACCGVKTHRARDGSLTDYTKDALDRPTITLVTLGPKTTSTGYAYATETLNGRTLPKTTVTQTISAGSNTTGSLLISDSVSNFRGQTLISRSPDANGDNTPETTTYTQNPATRTDSTTGPDGITRTNSRYADGQSYTSISTHNGTPVSVLTTYDYVPHNLNGGGIKTTFTTSGEGVPSYDQSTYSNLADRAFRTESPGYNGSTLVSEIAFDERGRATGQSATGNPATLRVLDLLGETTESWTDSNGDGQFNDTAVNNIKDSVAKSASDFTTESQNICRRTRQWARNDANSDILLATTFRSTDSTYQKSVPLSGSAPVTVTTTPKSINGNATSETWSYLSANTHITQTTIITLNADGTTSSVMQNKDTTGVPITTTTQVADLQGRIVSVSDGRKPATSYSEFTAVGQPLKTTNSDGTYSITTLDSFARPTKQETYKADTTLIATVNTTHDSAGRVQAQWGTNTVPIFRDYDIQGHMKHLRTYRSSDLKINPATITAPASFDLTTWDYEPATGFLLSKTDSNDKAVQYTYTTDGKLLTRVWARSTTEEPKTTTYVHYPSGQLHTVNYSDATPDVTHAYDRLSRLTDLTNTLATTHFDYAADLSLDKETITYTLPGQTAFTRVLDRSAPSLGRDTGWELNRLNEDGSIAVTDNTAIYGYSTTTGRVATIRGASAGEFSYGYLAGSNLLETITKPGLLEGQPILKATNIWEPTRDVLLTKANTTASDVNATPVDISSITYSVNPLGQRTHASRTREGAAANSTGWGYDLLGQLIAADDSTADNSADRGYLFDAIGNRRGTRNGAVGVPTGEDGSITPNVGTAIYAASQLNQYTTIPQAPAAPTYDFDGNMKTGPLPVSPTETSNLIWDGENHLGEVQDDSNATIANYYYDAQSRCIAKTAGNLTTLYLYDGWNCIAEYSISDNQCSISRTYLWGLDISESMQGAGGVGGMLALHIHTGGSQGFYYPCYDGNGNITEYLTATGAVFAHFEYDPFGNTLPTSTGNTGWFNYRFSTKSLDFETGFHYYGNRYYDPVTGRWPSRDSIEEEGGVNLYGFCNNDGVNFSDYVGNSILLKYEDVISKAANKGTCGAVNWKIKWILDGLNDKGAIVQQMTIKGSWKYCGFKRKQIEELEDSKIKDDALKTKKIDEKYTEYWDVTKTTKNKKNVFVISPNEFDNWSLPSPGVCTKGEVTWNGEAQFFQGFQIPGKATPGGNRSSLTLRSHNGLEWPSSKSYTDKSNRQKRKMSISWDCCDGLPGLTIVK